MTESEKPDWGNRVILLIFGVLALITIGGTIVSTMHEWDEAYIAGPQAVEDIPTIDQTDGDPDEGETPEEADGTH